MDLKRLTDFNDIHFCRAENAQTERCNHAAENLDNQIKIFSGECCSNGIEEILPEGPDAELDIENVCDLSVPDLKIYRDGLPGVLQKVSLAIKNDNNDFTVASSFQAASAFQIDPDIELEDINSVCDLSVPDLKTDISSPVENVSRAER